MHQTNKYKMESAPILD